MPRIRRGGGHGSGAGSDTQGQAVQSADDGNASASGGGTSGGGGGNGVEDPGAGIRGMMAKQPERKVKKELKTGRTEEPKNERVHAIAEPIVWPHASGKAGQSLPRSHHRSRTFSSPIDHHNFPPACRPFPSPPLPHPSLSSLFVVAPTQHPNPGVVIVALWRSPRRHGSRGEERERAAAPQQRQARQGGRRQRERRQRRRDTAAARGGGSGGRRRVQRRRERRGQGGRERYDNASSAGRAGF